MVCSRPSSRSQEIKLAERGDQMKTRDLIDLEVGQDLRQPRGVVARVKPADQRGAVGLGASERVEQVTGAGYTDGGGDSSVVPPWGRQLMVWVPRRSGRTAGWCSRLRSERSS